MADDNEEAAGGESRGQMLQRHKRELADVKKAIARLSKKQKDDGVAMMDGLLKRHEAELAALVRTLSELRYVE